MYTYFFCVIQALLKRSGTKSTLNAADKSGNTVLHIAALLGHDSIFHSLLSHSSLSSLINSPNANGETPIHLASSSDNFNIVKELVEAGADLKLLTKDGLTPYQVYILHFIIILFIYILLCYLIVSF